MDGRAGDRIVHLPGHALTVPELIREQVARHGDRLFLIDGERRLTYREVERRSAELARGLIAGGVGKATRVGLLMGNGPDAVIAWLAASRAGALVVPLSTFSRARELHWLLRHADVHTLLTTDRYLRHDYLERLEEIAPGLAGQEPGSLLVPELPQLRAVRVWGGGRSWAFEEPAALEAAAAAVPGIDEAFLRAIEDSVSPADLAVMIYTSGSTADPKGAYHSHGTLVRHSRIVSEFLGGGPGDRVYAPPPIFWVGGFHRILHTLQIGAAMTFLETFEAGAALEMIRRERVSILMLWPHQCKALLEHPDYREGELDFLQAAPYPLLREGERPESPDLVANSIGMTESFSYHTVEATGAVLPVEKRGACGRPVPGTERQIRDPGTGERLPAGTSGELCLRGFNVMQGLYKREREEVFMPDGFYRTGDRGYIDADDYYFFEGRLGDMIKTGGANVSPREVEAVLVSLDEVEQAHVVGVDDPEMGQVVVAGIVPATPGKPLDTDALRARLREQLSAFKVPRHMVPLEADEIPFTDTGKLHGKRLRELLAARVPR